MIVSNARVAWDEAGLPMLDAAEAAARERSLGRRVRRHAGCWWVEIVPGFYQPVALLTELEPEQATRPAPWCWGFRARLAAPGGAVPDAAMPLHVLPDLRSYGLHRLGSAQRNKIRKSLREVEIVALRSPELLLAQGHRVVREAHARNPGVTLATEAGFERWVRSYFAPLRGLVLAGVVEGRLLGFSASVAVDGVVYGDAAFASAAGLRHNLPACLFHALATIASRSPGAASLVYGLHARENRGLCDFKRRLGLEVQPVPARAWLAPMAEPLLRRMRPHVHYRLTGRG